MSQDKLSLIEEVEDVVEAGNRVEEHAVGHEILARESRQETKV